MLDKRELLHSIIKEHIQTASPVGSKMLSRDSHFEVSSATIRNAMAELEKEGLITQPHTSAGRIPTEKGYRYYLENIVKETDLSLKRKEQINQLLQRFKSQAFEDVFKQMAKKLVEMTDNAVIVAFSENDFYYTGLANLFSQPEFHDPECVRDLSLVMDELDKVMDYLFDKIEGPEVKIGSKNPFGQSTSVVMTDWKVDRSRGILGILGPMRMDYEKNLSIVNYLKTQLA